MSKFIIEITSVPDRENLVVEIWYDENLIAEINQEKDDLEIDLYPYKRLTFRLQDLLDILDRAKKMLRGVDQKL
jgi:hypothetical protein